MQLLLYKKSYPVLADDLRADMGCTLDFAQAIPAAAKTFEGLGHIPFRGRIEESHFISLFDPLKGDHLHGICVEEDVGVTTVIDVLQMLRLQHDMLIDPNLYGEVSWGRQYRAGRETGDYLTGFIPPLGEECFLIINDILPDHGEDVIAYCAISGVGSGYHK
jgi:hypothetical protein